jgi:hypothetical protein
MASSSPDQGGGLRGKGASAFGADIGLMADEIKRGRALSQSLMNCENPV